MILDPAGACRRPERRPRPCRPLPAAENPAPVAAPDAAAEARYRACTAQVRSEPQRAIETANAWQRAGGGLLARQCLGLAYVALERWAPAATVYEQAAQDAAAASDPAPRRFLGPGRQCLARRRRFGPRGAGLRRGAGDDRPRPTSCAARSMSTAPAPRSRSAMLPAPAPISIARCSWCRPIRSPGIMSAALARRESNLARARTDIARAMQLAPDNPDIVLLAGTLAGLAGNMAEAERLYRRVAEGAPDTDAGRTARGEPGDAARGRGTASAGYADPAAGRPSRQPQSR